MISSLLCGIALLEVVKSEPSKVYDKIFRKSAIYAQIFDTFVLSKSSNERLCVLENELVHYLYDKYFTPNMMSSLKKSSLQLNLSHSYNMTLFPLQIKICMRQV